MRCAILLAAALLAGCTSEIERQTNEYTIMRRSGATSQELCDKAYEIAEIYREDGDTAGFEEWDRTGDIHCYDVELGI